MTQDLSTRRYQGRISPSRSGMMSLIRDLPPRMMQVSSGRPTTHPIPTCPAYTSVVVHREHPLPPDGPVFEEKNQYPEIGAAWKPPPFVVATLGPFSAPISRGISQPWADPDCAPINDRGKRPAIRPNIDPHRRCALREGAPAQRQTALAPLPSPFLVLRRRGLEPLTFGSVDRCSIQLS